MARRQISVFSLSFLDAMTCGFGAVVLFYMIINASVGVRAGKHDLGPSRPSANRLEVEVLEGHVNLVELRNSEREVQEQHRPGQRAGGQRLLDQIEQIRVELATAPGVHAGPPRVDQQAADRLEDAGERGPPAVRRGAQREDARRPAALSSPETGTGSTSPV